MPKWSSAIVRASALLAALILSACHSGAGQGEVAHPSEPGRIAIVVSTLNNPWFVVLANTARAEAQRRGHPATIFDSQNDPAKEAAHFENLVTSGYRAVLFGATDAKGSVANALQATRAGVPVFTMDREIDSREAAVSQVLSDNYAGAEALGEYFVEQLGEHGNYVELLGIVGDNNTWNRSRGFHSVVDRFPGFKMVAQQSADFDRSRALEVMESILQAHPDIDAVFCGNDAMALGAYQALLGIGRANKVKVFGFDGSQDAVNAVAQGKMTATAMQYPTVMAATAAEFADRYLKGDRKLPRRVPVAVDLITRSNATRFVQ
jgi:ribose transport system substrate-binding protein